MATTIIAIIYSCRSNLRQVAARYASVFLNLLSIKDLEVARSALTEFSNAHVAVIGTGCELAAEDALI